ncbi:MAG: hypothetical protein VX252_10220 [Myxococcota bacterium]|nr:hypothetical protein [Myxococcota bacterium]
MTRFLRRISCVQLALGVIAVGFFASAASSEGPDPSDRAWESASTSYENSPEPLARFHERLSEAESRLDESRKALRKARQRRYPRGEALEELRQRARDNEYERVQAENAFLRRIEQARREEEETREWSAYLDRAEEIEEARLLRAQSR